MKLFLLTVICFMNCLNVYAINPRFFDDPALSPDGEWVCFNYISDLWIVPWEGGEARRITYSNGNDINPLFSPCGEYIAFSSDRDGLNGIYIINSKGGSAQLVTDEPLTVVDWFNDSNRLLASGYDIKTRSRNLYTVYLDGRRPVLLTEVGGFFSKLSPDNMKIIFDRKGLAHRPAYTGSLAGEIWEYCIETSNYTQLTFTDTTERYPVYSHINPFIYYSASDGNVFQVYRAENYDFNNPVQLSTFDRVSARDLKIARNNDRIVFELFDKIYKYDPIDESFNPLEIQINKDILSSFNSFETVTNMADKFFVSPDGKFIVFSYKYDLFTIPEKGGDVVQITNCQSGIKDIVIMDDNRTIFFLKNLKGVPKLFKFDFNNLFSSDKRFDYVGLAGLMDDIYVNYLRKLPNDRLMLDYTINRRDYNKLIFYYKNNTYKKFNPEKTVISPLVYSNCDNFIFYTNYLGNHFIREFFIYDQTTEKNHYIFASENYIGGYLTSSNDNFLFMNDNGNLIRLDLIPQEDFVNIPNYWKDVFPEIEKEKRDDVELNKYFDSLIHRKTTLVSDGSRNFPLFTENDSTLFYISRKENVVTINSINFFGDNKTELVSLSSSATDFTYNEKSKNIYFLKNNNIHRVNTASRIKDRISFKFNYDFDELELNKNIFDIVWVEFGQTFYDEKMHGIDWYDSYDYYAPFVDFAYTPVILKKIIDEMIGEVNASHTGFYVRRDNARNQRNTAYGGFELDFKDLLDEGIRVSKIFKESRLLKPFNIQEGDILLAVDGVKIDPYTSINSLFLDKVNERIRLTFRTSEGKKDVEILGLTRSQHLAMYYNHWVQERIKKVEQLSDGRVGYLHIERMNQPSYNRFLRDFYAMNYHKEAIIIDVRNNGGGNISSRLLDVIEAEKRAYTTSSRFPGETWTSPRRVVDKPLAVIVNERSHSDSEIFPSLFSYFDIGPVVGVPTSGSVIGTVNITLIDGSTIRMPRSGWFTLDMVNMEGTGAKPDIYVDHHISDIIKDNDLQLKTAVEILLQKLNN